MAAPSGRPQRCEKRSSRSNCAKVASTWAIASPAGVVVSTAQSRATSVAPASVARTPVRHGGRLSLVARRGALLETVPSRNVIPSNELFT
jgi:hypothetical protein